MLSDKIKALKYLWGELRLIVKANGINARYLDIPAKKNRVNLFEYYPKRFGYKMYQDNPYNLGDSLGEVITRYLLEQKGIDIDKPVSKTKHFYSVGSNIQGGYQDATIWGSGMLLPMLEWEVRLQKLSHRKLDIRALRGPLTKEFLEKTYGYKCPNVFGDPAILMPLIYQPKVEKMHDSLVIPQFCREDDFRNEHPDERMVSMNTNDYKHVIDEIAASKIVYTSSLHGIILAEAYGVPAIFFRWLGKKINFKYLDYYYSTGRRDIKIAESLEEAKQMEPLPLPDLSKLQQGLLDTFPYDLWEP